ncbi:MAG: ornithine carbamoyltransferase [Candidatus Omnitrophota bacterium]|nr:ornithine carbamoyltransferase [Candidatus Omnitrophota bacterium]
MKPKHLVTLQDLDRGAILQLFRTTAELKQQRKAPSKPLAGKTLGLLFQKPSVRTRVSFEVGMGQLGGTSLYIGPVELQEGKREAPKDMARVLSRYLDGIVARTFRHSEVEEMARFSDIPVINGLSDTSHPCQGLADLFTVQEKKGRLQGVKIAYIGDGNNVCHSLMEGCALLGVHLSVATPKGYLPDPVVARWALQQAKKSGARIEFTLDPARSVRGATVVYTDVWTSMGQEQEKLRRQKAFKGFRVDSAMMKAAGREALFMHCLPAHRGEEVTDEVMDSKQSIVYDQAENRLHVQKAILLSLLKK